MTGKVTPIARKDLFHYSMLAVPVAFAGMPLYVHAPDYYATEFGLSLATIGFILLFLRSIDAVQDPLIGRLSDRFSKNCPQIIISASVLLVLAFAGLFNPLSVGGILVWFALMVLLATTAFSILSINLNTLGGMWSRNSHQKTLITTTREGFGLIGLLLAVILPSLLMQTMSKTEAFGWVSLVFLFLAVAGIVFFLRWYKNHAASSALPTESCPKQSVITLLRSMPKETRGFFAVYGISMLASSIPAILVLFFIRDRLGAENYAGLFLLLYFLSGAAGMPLWSMLSRKWNKHRAWIAAMLLAIMTFFWAYFLGSGDIWQYAVICVLSGIAFGADLALPPSILADHIHAQNSEQHASLQFGLFTFLAKAALAIGSVLVLPFLDWSGFRAGEVNTPDALFFLSLTYAAIPCAIKLIAAVMLWRISSNPTGAIYENNISNNITDRSHPHA